MTNGTVFLAVTHSSPFRRIQHFDGLPRQYIWPSSIWTLPRSWCDLPC